MDHWTKALLALLLALDLPDEDDAVLEDEDIAILQSHEHEAGGVQ